MTTTTDFDLFLSDLCAPMEITWSSAATPKQKVQADLRFYEQTARAAKLERMRAQQRLSDEACGLIHPPHENVSP